MPFLLRFDGVDDLVDIRPYFITIGIGDTLTIEWENRNLGKDAKIIGTLNNFNHVFERTAAGVYRYRTGGSPVRTISSANLSGRIVNTLTRTAAGVELTENGVFLGTFADTGNSGFNIFGAWSGGSNPVNYGEIDIYFVSMSNASVDVFNYDPSASNGTGTTLIDTAGGNNGTLVNFPTDDSQWVFYDDGGEPPVEETLLKYWNGSAWVSKPLKMWNGSDWIRAPLKRWNGSAWVEV